MILCDNGMLSGLCIACCHMDNVPFEGSLLPATKAFLQCKLQGDSALVLIGETGT